MRPILNALPVQVYLRLKWNYARVFDRENFNQLQRLRQDTTEGTFSFREFDKRQAIFVHIPKCAGIAIKRALFNDLSGGHTKLSSYCRVFEPELFLTYFKFTFIRNPWDRLVSAYHFLRAGGYNDADRRWFDRELGTYSDFDDFVRNWLRPENLNKHIHFHPQIDFLRDPGHRGIHVDYIGFYENITRDFNYIAERIGVNSPLKQRNASEHKSYQDYYTDTTREIVRKVYICDIEGFGYDFENANLPAQIAARDAPEPAAMLAAFKNH